MKIVKFKDINIEIYDYIFDTIKNLAKETTNEQGGILLGHRQIKTNTYIISEITTPTNNDESGHTFFVRKKTIAQKIIDKLWKTSDGVINYIGEWHTHPEPFPTPSGTDKFTWKKISLNHKLPYKCKINLIVGNDKTYYLCVMKKGKIVYETSKEI